MTSNEGSYDWADKLIWSNNRSYLLKKLLRVRDKYLSKSLDFKHSLGYIMQATRNRIIGYVGDDVAVIYTSKTIEPSSGPVIVASFGKDTDDLITRIAKKTAMDSGLDVIVKNVDPGSGLEEAGFEDYREDEQWDENSKYDDNTFPQQVIDVHDCLDLEGSKYAKLREEVNRFDRENDVEVTARYSSGEFDSMLSLWADQMAERRGLDREELVRSHKMFRNPDYPFMKRKIVDKRTGKLVGLLGMSNISNLCLGHNLMINDFSIRGSCRRLQYEAVRIASSMAYHYLNIQGSEDENQHRSKRKFRAPIEIPKKHLVWRA